MGERRSVPIVDIPWVRVPGMTSSPEVCIVSPQLLPWVILGITLPIVSGNRRLGDSHARSNMLIGRRTCR